MLTTIPRRILRDTATFSVPVAFDRYQHPTSVEEYEVANVHVQSDNATRKSTGNTEVTLRGTLFVDGRLSIPQLDYNELQEKAQKAGGVITCHIKDRRGRSSGPYTVLVVDSLPDDEGNLHHYELGLA